VDREFDAEEPTGTAWQRLGAVCGIAAVLALVAATLVVPQPPKADASTGKILAYYIGHRHTLLFSQWLGGLGTALFLWFAGSLRGAWARNPGSARELSAVAFGGGVALAALAFAGTGVNLTLVYLARPIQNSIDLVSALYLGQALALTLSFFAVLITGRWPEGLRNYIVGVHRWAYRVQAYVYLLTDAYPPFRLEP